MYPFCHYIKDPETGTKVLIPGCWGTVHSGDMEDCCCERKILKELPTIESLAAEVKRLRKENKELWNELNKLRKCF